MQAPQHPIITRARLASVTLWRAVALLPAAALLVLHGCSGGGAGGSAAPSTPQGTTTGITRIDLTPGQDTLRALGETLRFTAAARDANGRLVQANFTWSSVTPSVATVDAAGMVRAVGNGSTRINASAAGITGSALVVVLQVARSIALSPTADTLLFAGDTTRFAAVAQDLNGNLVPGVVFVWSTSDPAVATVNAAGLVVAVRAGTAVIRAAAGAVTGAATVVVASLGVIGAIAVQPTRDVLLTGGTKRYSATLFSPAGDTLRNIPISWSAAPAHVARVDSTGLATALAPGSVTITASAQGKNGLAVLSVFNPPARGTRFTWIGAGVMHVCAASTDQDGWCWGNVAEGALGQGTFSQGPLPFPHRLVSAPKFQAASGAALNSCGLSTTNHAYCWGAQTSRLLGLGGTGIGSRATPVLVTDSLTFSRLTIGVEHACGLTASGDAYCWGLNRRGALGSGAPEGFLSASTNPLIVTGGLRFTMLSAGADHTCGIATNGEAWCWGSHLYGQLGVGAAATSAASPVRVAGGLTWTHISAGTFSTCGVASGGTAYCWGSGPNLGSTATATNVPRAVSGGITFQSVAVYKLYATVQFPAGHSCGIATDGGAWCWGPNPDGQLGDGSRTTSSVPVRVAGAQRFTQLTLGYAFTCGLTDGGLLFCWGRNAEGVLGDGTIETKLVPTPALTN